MYHNINEAVTNDEAMATTSTNGSNYNQRYLVSAYCKLETWLSNTSGNEYFGSARFEWLSHPLENHIDTLNLVNDGKLTRLSNSTKKPYFVAKAEIVKKYTYNNNSTWLRTEIIKESNYPLSNNSTSVGFDYRVPIRSYAPVTSREYDVREGLKGYISSYYVANSRGTIGFGSVYAHEKKYLEWNQTFGISIANGAGGLNGYFNFSISPQYLSYFETLEGYCTATY